LTHLLREHAPIAQTGWKLLDDEARERLTPALAARRLVDFSGPHGWDYSATNLGRVESIDAPGDGVAASKRQVLGLVELRAHFSISRAQLDDAERGAPDIDLDTLDAAARRIAVAENAAVFHGLGTAGIRGIAETSSHDRINLGEDCEVYPRHVAKAVDALRSAGIDGPYGLALSPEGHTHVLETAEHGGYPLMQHLQEILGGAILWAPGVDGGVVVSLRGGDFLFQSGQDLSIGYEAHDADAVQLYLEESFSFRVATPEAAVPLPA
jgi:uncharacterized linocin/CFP29 family protein